MRRVIDLIVACGLMAIALYVVMYIPTIVDFNNVVIRLEDNDTIYRFLIYLPLILCIFNSLLNIINTFSDNVTVSFMSLFISIAVIVFIAMNIMGSVNALKPIGKKLYLVMYVNMATAVLLIISIITFFIKKKKKVKPVSDPSLEGV